MKRTSKRAKRLVERTIKNLSKLAVELQEVGNEEKFWDLLHYAEQLEEMVSCDDGEAGLVNLLEIINNEK